MATIDRGTESAVLRSIRPLAPAAIPSGSDEGSVTATVADPSGNQTFSGFGLGKWGAVIPGKTGGSVIYTDTDAKSLVS